MFGVIGMFEVIGFVVFISLIAVCLLQIGASIIIKSKGYETIDSKDDTNTDPEINEHGIHSPLMVESEQKVDEEAKDEIIKKDIDLNEPEIELIIVEFDAETKKWESRITKNQLIAKEDCDGQ